MNKREAQQFVKQWQGKRLAVLGDLILDRYIWGAVSRVSPEAPIPVLDVRNETARPGAGANLLHNIQMLGGEGFAFGVLGDDGPASTLCNLLFELKVDCEGIIRDDERVTTVKARIYAAGQQILRVDRERVAALRRDKAEILLRKFQTAMDHKRLDGVIVVDHGKGVISRDLLQTVVQMAASHQVPVAFHPHAANPITVPGLTWLSMSRAEAFAMAGVPLNDGPRHLEEDRGLLNVAERIQAAWDVWCLLITMGPHGIALFRKGKPQFQAVMTPREVYDGAGAGDSVTAAFVLAILGGAAPEEAVEIANHAGGIAVAKVGAAPVFAAELIESFN